VIETPKIEFIEELTNRCPQPGKKSLVCGHKCPCFASILVGVPPGFVDKMHGPTEWIFRIGSMDGSSKPQLGKAIRIAAKTGAWLAGHDIHDHGWAGRGIGKCGLKN